MKVMRKVRIIMLLCVLVISSTIIVSGEQMEARENDTTSNDNPEQLQVEKNHSDDFVPGHVLVGMKPNTPFSYTKTHPNLFSGIEIDSVDVILTSDTNTRSDSIGEILLLKLKEENKSSVLDAITLLEELSEVEFAEPDYLYHLDDIDFIDENIENEQNAISNNNFIPTPANPLWNMARIEAPSAWRTTTGRTSIKVGVIDSGIDHNHPNLSRNVNTSLGYDFVSNKHDASDVHGHGTHIAGIIGAFGNNNANVIGVAPQVTMIPLRVLNRFNGGQVSNFVRAINYSNQQNLDIINYSITGVSSQALANSIRAFNGLFVVAAGNNGRDIDSQYVFPASWNIPNMITVGNSNDSDQRSSSSNYGRQSVDLFAPGNRIISTLRRNQFGNMSGTSMAAPHVTGAAVLALSMQPSLTPIELKAAIMNSVDSLSAFNNISVSGGRLNVAKLVDQLHRPTSEGIAYTFRTEIYCQHPWYSRSQLEHCHPLYLANIKSFNGSQKRVLIPSVAANDIGTLHTVRSINTHDFANKGLERIEIMATQINQISHRAFAGNPLEVIIVPTAHANPNSALFKALENGMQGVTTNTILQEQNTPKYRWNGVNAWVPIN